MALFTVLIATACKKDNEKGITGKLMNNWSLVQITDTVYAPNTAPAPSKYDGKPNEYLDFRKDGKLYSFVMNALDTAQYIYSEANLKLDVGGFQYKIIYLTDVSMVLWEPHFSTSTTGYIAHKVTLRR